MRKILFTLLAVGAMLAAIPAASLAHGGDYQRGDRHREREHQREHARHHDRFQHERFGGKDGIGHDAGTVSSFANGRLTILLNDGSSVTGAVNRFSEIECEMPRFMQPADQGPGGSGSGSSGGPGDGNGQNGNDGNGNGQDGPGHNDGNGNGNGNGNGQNGQDNDPGDDNGQRQCTMVAPGMVVRDATLTLTGFGAVWTRVDLIDS